MGDPEVTELHRFFESFARRGAGSLRFAVESQFLVVLDDKRGFIVNAVFFANLVKVLVPLQCIVRVALQISFAPRSLWSRTMRSSRRRSSSSLPSYTPSE